MSSCSVRNVGQAGKRFRWQIHVANVQVEWRKLCDIIIIRQTAIGTVGQCEMYSVTALSLLPMTAPFLPTSAVTSGPAPAVALLQFIVEVVVSSLGSRKCLAK